MLEVICTSCAHRFGIDDSAAGEPISCPYCGAKMTAPIPTAILATAVTQATPPPVPPTPRQQIPPHQRASFWTGARIFGLICILFASSLCLYAYVSEYGSQGSRFESGPVAYTRIGDVTIPERALRAVPNPPSLTDSGKSCLYVAAFFGGLGLLLLLVGGQSHPSAPVRN